MIHLPAAYESGCILSIHPTSFNEDGYIDAAVGPMASGRLIDVHIGNDGIECKAKRWKEVLGSV